MSTIRLLRAALLCLLFLSILPASWAQNKTINGKVLDDKGAPIQGASVLVKGTNSGTTTDASGVFTITVPSSATTLTITYVGYTPQDVSIVSTTQVSVAMIAATSSLNDVIVIGYGTARKRDVTGAVASVKAKDFNQGVIAAPDQLLQGKVAGLEITNNSGQPGAATTIKIRGNNSIRTNNNPLYVIDGVPLDGRTARPSLNLGTNGLDYGPTPETNPLLYINPNDIAQIDVLKDASATAIYGSRGANGIIVITTKKGTANGTHLEAGAYWGIPAGYMKKYKVMSASQFREFDKANNLNFDSSASVDALKEITQNTLSQNYTMALSGGNESGKFRVSFLGSKNAGFIKKTSLDKYIANFSGQYDFIDKRLSVDFNLIAGHTTEHMGLVSNTSGAGGTLMAYALNWNPTKAFTTSDGFYSAASNSIPNPLAAIDAFNDVANVNVFLGNISASLKIFKGLEYKMLYAVNHGAGIRRTNFDGWIDNIKGVSGLGFGAISNATLTSQTFTHTLSYNTNFSESLGFDAVVGYEYWKSSYANSTIAASQFNTNLSQSSRMPMLYTSFFQNAKTQFPMTTNVDPNTEIQSYFGRVNFNYLQKYYLTATLRGDGSNKFGANNKYGYFPSVGAKWIISNESFLKNGAFLNNLDLRLSWGITGNQEFPAGASLEQFTSSAYNSIGQSNVANPDLKWEKTTSYNAGLDYSILKNRIVGSLDYYHKTTTDLLFQNTAIQPAPASIYFINLPAHLVNSGVEFSVGAGIVQNKAFSWDAAFNIAYNKNLLKDFTQAPIQTGKVSGQGVSGSLAQVITNNQPVNEFFLKKFSGFDRNGQQIIADTPSFEGDPNPHVLMGLSSTLRYHKFSFSFNATGATGFLIYNNTYNTITNISNIQKGQNVAASAIGSAESISSGVAASSRYLEKGDYVKLRNATLSYAFGDVGKFLKNFNVYVSGTNLFVITKFTGFDPEVNVDANNNNYPTRSMEFLPYPTARVLTFGLNFGL